MPSAPLTKSISLKSASALIKLILGVYKAKKMLSEFGADVVLGTGGYTSAAVVIAQTLRKKKTVIHEQNAVPGKTNLWLSKYVDKVCISFKESERYFPKEKTILTGMPIREEFIRLQSKKEARLKYGLKPDVFTILIIGGSQGAAKLNQIALEMWQKMDNKDIQIIHQVGKRNYDSSIVMLKINKESYTMKPYLDVPLALAASDLVICRSGASSLAEVLAAGLPSILVPFPYAYADHQKKNAEIVAASGAAVLIDESNLTADLLTKTVIDFKNDSNKLEEFSTAAKIIAVLDASERVAKILLD